MPAFSPAPHVIARQQLRLRLPATLAPADAPALHRQAEQALLGPPLLAALEAALTQALAAAGHPATAWLTLDHVALDLGLLRRTHLEAEVRERLPGLLARHVAAALAAGPAGAGRPGAASPGAGPDGAAVPAAAALGSAWLHFLRLGYLPTHWPAPASPASWEAELRRLLARPPAPLAGELRSVLAAETARLRLLRQFSPGLGAAVLRLLAGPAAPTRARLAALLAALLAPAPAAAALAAATTPVVAAGAAPFQEGPVPTGESVALRLLAHVVAGQPLPWAGVLATLAPAGLGLAATRPAALHRALRLLASPAADALADAAATASLPPASSPAGPVAAPVAAPVASPGAATGAAPPPPGSYAAAPVLLPSHPADAPSGLLAGPDGGSSPATRPGPGPHRPGEPSARPPAGAGPAETDGAAGYVAHAGVVLLHPFLPACFAACGWLNEAGQFGSAEAQAQAVLLVHFLATGRGQAPEYELRLPRLLCGVPPTAPPPRRLVLGAAARAEGRALLRAALAHWSALRRTTPRGLRTAFLQREGKLELVGPAGVPTLTVAQQAQDVLLGRLPYGWSVGLVQLPWMPQRLLVSWA